MRRFETERMLKGSKPNINIASAIDGELLYINIGTWK